MGNQDRISSVSKAATVVLLMNILAKVLGLVRESAIAGVFGANLGTDAYKLAYSLPYSLQQVLGQALLTVTVPLLIKYLVDGKKEEANLVANYLTNAVAVVMIVVTGVCVLFAPFLVQLLGPSLSSEAVPLATTLTRIMFPSVIFMSLGMVFSGMLNANHKFISAAFAPAFSSFIIIFSALYLGRKFGIEGLAVGTLFSFVGFLLVVLPGTFRTGFRYRPKLSFRHPDIKMAMLSLIPIVVGTSVNQIYYILNRGFASGLPEGTISALDYATKVVNLPSGIFVAAIVVAVYPQFSEFALKGERELFINSLERGMGLVMLLAIPSTIGLMTLAEPIVSLLFERGAFDAVAAANTSLALFWYAIGIFPYCAIMILLKAFYAFDDIKMPIYAGIFGIITNVIVSVLTMNIFGLRGLALGTSLASTVNMLVFFIALKKHLPTIKYGSFLQSFVRILISSLGMGAAVIGSMKGMAALGISSNVSLVLIGVLIGVVVYFIFAFILRVKEVMYLKDMVQRKLHRN